MRLISPHAQSVAQTTPFTENSAQQVLQGTFASTSSYDGFVPSSVNAKRDLCEYLIKISEQGHFYCDLTLDSPADNFEAAYYRARLYLAKGESSDLSREILERKYLAYEASHSARRQVITKALINPNNIVKPTLNPHSPSLQTYSPDNLRLDTHSGRVAFQMKWQALTRPKPGHNCKKMCIKGVLLPAKKARQLLCGVALASYVNAARDLKTLSSEILKVNNSPNLQHTLQEQFREAERTLDEIEKIIHIDEIKKQWHKRTSGKLAAQIEASNQIFVKYAKTQGHMPNHLLAQIDNDTITNPAELTQEMAQVRKQIGARWQSYRWSEHSCIVMGAVHELHPDIEREFGDKLPGGFINLANSQGREVYNNYCKILENAIDQYGSKAGSIIINGLPYRVKDAQRHLSLLALRTFQQLAERYLELDNLVRNKIALDAKARSESSTRDIENFTEELVPLREEMEALRKELPSLAQMTQSAFTHVEAKEHTQRLNQQLQRVLDLKKPASSFEKKQALERIKNLSQQMAHSTKNYKALQKQHSEQWHFLKETCDSENLDQLFDSSPLKKLGWTLDTNHNLEETSEAHQRWLRAALSNVSEMAKNEWAHSDKVRKFALFLSDPQFRKMIDKHDQTFLDETIDSLRIALTVSQELAGELDSAIGIKIVNEDYNAVTLTSSIGPTLDKMTPKQSEEIILKLCNTFASGRIDLVMKSVRAFLNEEHVSLWNRFVKKYKREIATYWNHPKQLRQKNDPRGPNQGYNNLIYVPFQRRVGDYGVTLKALKQDAPPQYRDALELTYLRIASRAKNVNALSINN